MIICENKIQNKIINLLNDYFTDSQSKPVWDYKPKENLITDIQGHFTEQGIGEDNFISLLKNVVIKHSMNLQNPMYMGHQVPPVLPMAAAIDYVISSLNQSLVISRMSPVMSLIELELLKFINDKIGYDNNSGGTVTSGGSISNLLGLVCARNKYFPDNNLQNAVVLCPEQSHYSVMKASFIAGIKKENIIKLPCDENFKIKTDELADIAEKLKRQNLKPFVLFANAGSTSTSSFDKLDELNSFTRENDIWLHVDAAHGGCLIFSEALNHKLNGLSKADSVSIDGHKMMFMPSSLGLFSVQDKTHLASCFEHIDAPYLYNDTDEIISLSKYSLQCTKRADSLKLWGCLIAYGTDFFAEKYHHLHGVTRYFYEQLKQDKVLEPVNYPEFNIICFRYAPKHAGFSDDDLNRINFEIRDRVNKSGETMITITKLNQKIYLRATLTNPATDKQHVDGLINLIKSYL